MRANTWGHSIYVAIAAVLIAAQAHAATPAWSANATTCSADADTIVGQRYTTTGGKKVAHRGNNVDQIQLVCAITNPESFLGILNWNLVVTYRDSTGAGTSAFVQGRILRVARAAGNSAAVATFNSNSSAATTVTKGSIGFAHTFDFNTYYYTMQIALDRTSTSEIVEAYGVAIERAPD